MARQTKQGEGWQLGWDADAEVFQGLVGGSDWAIELTGEELEDFCCLVVQLAETLRQVSQELMDEERISCEVESDRLWLEAEGFPHCYSLRLILLTGRRTEGAWSGAAVAGLTLAAQMLKVF